MSARLRFLFCTENISKELSFLTLDSRSGRTKLSIPILIEAEKISLQLVWEASLIRLNKLLKKLGNPHLDLPNTIHIAGTNGIPETNKENQFLGPINLTK